MQSPTISYPSIPSAIALRGRALLAGLALAALTTLASCGDKAANLKDPTEAKAELAKLKAERTELDAKIVNIEKQLVASGAMKAPDRTRQVALLAVQPATFAHYLDLQGKVDAEDNVMATPQMPGTITRVYIDEGSTVRAGQVIAELDATLLRGGMDELQTSLTLAKDVFQRQKGLWDQKIGTEIQYLQAKNTYESLQNRMASMNQQLGQMRVKAPISGTVDQVLVDVGSAVAPGVPVARVINTNRMIATAAIPESYASQVRQGSSVKVFLPDLNRTVSGQVSFATKAIDPINRTFDVEVRLPSSAGLRPNMIAQLRIEDARRPNALAVPVGAVASTEDGAQYLFVGEKRDGKTYAKRRAVKTGLTYNGMAEITEGLAAGDNVVTVGFQDLNEGDVLVVDTVDTVDTASTTKAGGATQPTPAPGAAKPATATPTANTQGTTTPTRR